MRKLRPKAAMVVAVIALVAACAGTAVAGPGFAKIKANSIGSKQIKDSSITGGDVADGSLSPADFTGSVQGPAGPAGPAGAQGQQGQPGAPGLAALQRVQIQQSIANNGNAAIDAVCPAGKSPIAGGYEVIGAPMAIKVDAPVNTNGSGTAPLDAWRVQAVNTSGSSSTLRVYAVCATVTGGFPNPG
jgi:hypothetical protein